jgi:hypothetical protein
MLRLVRFTATFYRQTAVMLAVSTLAVAPICAAEEKFSTPPLAVLPTPSDRPKADGPARFVDAEKGSDDHDGSEAKPWRTVMRGLSGTAAGETLYLRGGVYYENVRLATSGRPDAPITIRSYPGELATIDGGYAEFARNPAAAWEPVEGTKDEFRSTRTYGNIRYALGSFGDSLVGLNTYYHRIDLTAEGEEWVTIGVGKDANPALSKSKAQREDIKPVYCGPGLWYDPASQRIHARLAHTHLVNRPNYSGPTDPRLVPLVVTPAHAVPLHFDGAQHVRLQDLVIRGGGHDTVLFDQADQIEFDNVTVWCGANGLRAKGLRNFKLHHSGLYGNVPPWTFRTDTSLRARPGSGTRDVTRLNTHAMLVPDGNREFDVYAFPQNDQWEISYCTFSDGHDGVYVGGLNVRFHHNLIERTQDDGIYLSPMYPSYSPLPYEVHVYQNVIRNCLTALAFGGPEVLNTDKCYIYRNVIDMTAQVPTGRPTEPGMPARTTPGNPMGDHGSPPWSAMWIYQNTVHTLSGGRSAEASLTNVPTAERPRYFVNNLLTAGYRAAPGEGASTASAGAAPKPAKAPLVLVPAPGLGLSDGNLYWFAYVDPTQQDQIFAKYRKSPEFEGSKEKYDGGFTSRSLTGDPKLDDRDVPQAGSPAVDAGAAVPAEWPDPLRESDAGKPDIGAIPAGGTPLSVGRFAKP